MRRWLVPRVVLPVYQRLGRRTFWTEVERLRALQWQSPDELEVRAAGRLRPLLAHAFSHVPHYRDLLRKAGIVPEEIRSIADLARIPVTSKSELRAGFPERVTADNLPARRRWASRTSGSTGYLLDFYTDRVGEDSRLAAYLFSLEWAGLGPWNARVLLSSPAYFGYTTNFPRLSPFGRAARRILLGERTIRMSGADLTLSQFQAVARNLRGGPGYYLRAYPSYGVRLARWLQEAAGDLAAYPQAVISMAETLTPVAAATMREAFRCPVINHYSAHEAPHMAQSCPDVPDVLHVNSERVILRVVREDGTTAGPGERGRVLLTALSNHVMPFINYDLGDVAVAGSPCPCGRGFPTLSSLEGRDGEQIRTPTGRQISPSALEMHMTFACRLLPYISEYQAFQKSDDAVTLWVVPTDRFTEEAATATRAALQELLGPDMTVTIEPVDRIPAEPSGKRPVIKSMERRPS